MGPEKQSNNKQEKISFESLQQIRTSMKEGTFQEILDDWRWIFRYSRPYRDQILLYVFLGILSTSLGLASSVAGKYLIDIITGYQTDKLVFLALIMVGTALSGILLNNWTNRIVTKLNIHINNDIQMDLFQKIMDGDWLTVSRYSNGDLLNRFNGDVSGVASNAISWLPNLVLSIYRFLATFFVILHYDWIMALIALGSAPILLFASRVLIKKQREYGKKVREVSSDQMAFEVESFYNYDTIKSFGASDQYSRKLRFWQKRWKDLSLDYNMFTIKTNVLLSVLGMIIQFIAFGYCLFRLWTHGITFGTMTLFLQQRSNLTSAFNSMVGVIPTFLSGSISAHRLKELEEIPGEEHLERSCELDEKVKDGLTVELRDVQFAYIQDKQVITESCMEAHPGQIVALIGPSGEGKTTIIRLILGLIHPESGETVLRASDGMEIIMNAETRHLFSYVPQGNTILSGTIAENLRMVKEDATEEELINALKTACAWEFVQAMPGGLHASVGERGHGLSEGQAQRIAIARAILRDAPVILLDEATSALDVTTERMVLRNIVSGNTGKTCIITTHRPSVLSMSDRVYRVVDTRVTELNEQEASQMAMDF